jgi:AcrR family transcriptional regulator
MQKSAIEIDKKAELINCGREVFAAQGFKKTKVAEIAERARMAVGSFYKIYESKEALFIDIYLEENEKVKLDLVAKFDFSKNPAETLAKALAYNYEAMMANPILREWYNPEVYAKIEAYYRERGERADAVMMHDATAQFVESWRSAGIIRDDIEPELILALFHAITYIDTHKEAIGIQYFPRLSHLLAEFVMKGLERAPESVPLE